LPPPPWTYGPIRPRGRSRPAIHPPRAASAGSRAGTHGADTHGSVAGATLARGRPRVRGPRKQADRSRGASAHLRDALAVPRPHRCPVEGEEVTVFVPVLLGVERRGAAGLDQCGVAGRVEDSLCGAEGGPAVRCEALLVPFEPVARPDAAAEHVAAVPSSDEPFHD